MQFSTAPYDSPPYVSSDLQSYTPYLPPFSQGFPGFLHTKSVPVKQEYYGSDDINPFSMSYASMAGVDMSYNNGACREPMIHVRPTFGAASGW